MVVKFKYICCSFYFWFGDKCFFGGIKISWLILNFVVDDKERSMKIIFFEYGIGKCIIVLIFVIKSDDNRFFR